MAPKRLLLPTEAAHFPIWWHLFSRLQRTAGFRVFALLTAGYPERGTSGTNCGFRKHSRVGGMAVLPPLGANRFSPICFQRWWETRGDAVEKLPFFLPLSTSHFPLFLKSKIPDALSLTGARVPGTHLFSLASNSHSLGGGHFPEEDGRKWSVEVIYFDVSIITLKPPWGVWIFKKGSSFIYMVLWSQEYQEKLPVNFRRSWVVWENYYLLPLWEVFP